MSEYYQKSLIIHERLRGKIEMRSKLPVDNLDDLSTVYTPGVAQPCREIAKDPELVNTLTCRGNSVAVVTDGSAVLGLGNIGPMAALPVMEGKALIFREFAGISAWPICLDTQDTQEIIKTIRYLAPTFGGINLEDISAPRCFEIEDALQDLGIPVFHDDQHGTAIVLLAGLINACRIQDRKVTDLKVVINGAGAAGTAIAGFLRCIGLENDTVCTPVKEIIVCDSKGAISIDRKDLSDEKRKLLSFTNLENRNGTIQEVMEGMDVFIGVSKGGLIQADDVAKMAKDPIVFALANPEPEIYPEEAYKGGAAVVATGRSDFPNQVNNALVFPGIFKGALDSRAKQITPSMKIGAAYALAYTVVAPTKERILPDPLDKAVVPVIARAVRNIVRKERGEIEDALQVLSSSTS